MNPKTEVKFLRCGVRLSRTQQRGMSELLETILWLRPRTGALRGGLCQPATTGNFGIRVQIPAVLGLFAFRVFLTSVDTWNHQPDENSD